MLDPRFSSFVVRKLNRDEHIFKFDCKDDDLNDYIINESHLYTEELLAVSYVMEPQTDTSHSHVAAYFSLANDKVSLEDFESKTEFNSFRKRFRNPKRLKGYPAVKLCRLAVDNESKGYGIGSFLLNFIKSYFITDNKTGCRFLTVDAYSEAIPFYLKNGFIPLNDDDEGQETRLLYFDLNDISNF